MTLIGNDPETCELTFTIVSGPSHGSLGSMTGIACNAGSPNYDYASVTYTVNDGTATSLQASAYLTVRAPSPAP